MPTLLIVVAAAAFLLLRTWGLHHGSPPILFHADERHYAGVAAQIVASGDLNPHRFENPPLLTYVLVGLRRLHVAWMGRELTDAWVTGGGLYLLARWIAAVLGTATAFVVAATARRLWGSSTAAVAAAVVVGLSFLHGRDSHYGVNDVPMVFLVSLSLLLAVTCARGGSRGLAFASAAVAGLAAATKYNGAVAVVLAPLALLLRTGPGGGPREGPGGDRPEDTGGAAPKGPGGGWRAALLAAPALGAVSVAVFVLANPYAVLAWEEFRDGFLNQYGRWGDNAIWGQRKAPGIVLYGEATLALLGWGHIAAALVGLVVAGRRQPRDLAWLLLFPALYLLGMLSKTLFFWRFALPLLPFGALAAARGWTALADRLPSRGRPLLLGGMLAAASAWPLAQLVRHDVLLTEPHTWTLAREWILRNVPPGSNLFIEGYPPSFPPGYRVYLPRKRTDQLHILRTDPERPDSPLAVPQGGWLVTDSFLEAGWQLEGEEQAASWSQFYAKLRERLRLVAEFPPGPRGDPRPFVLDSLYSPLVDLWNIERPGHTVRVYRIEPGEWLEKMMR